MDNYIRSQMRRSEIVAKSKPSTEDLVEGGRIDTILSLIDIENGDLESAMIHLMSAVSLIAKANNKPISIKKVNHGSS